LVQGSVRMPDGLNNWFYFGQHSGTSLLEATRTSATWNIKTGANGDICRRYVPNKQRYVAAGDYHLSFEVNLTKQ